MPSALPRLTLRFDPVPGEAPTSWLSRLAMRNGSDLESFAALIGIELGALIDGSPDVIDRLAQIADTDPRPLRSASFSRVGPRSFLRNGQYFPRHVVRTPSTRICPDCLRQDARISGLPHQIGMAFRSDWQVPFLRACPRHNRALVEVWTDSDRTRRHDFATRIGLVMPQIMTGDLDTPALPVSPYEQWLTRRLGGETTEIWLDRFALTAAATFTELLGRSLLLEKLPRTLKLSPVQWRMAADVGFFSASKGEAQIRKALLHIQERAGAPNDGLHARLGPLYDRFSRDLDGPEFAPFRELLRDHILTTWPLASGDEVLGHRVETRQFHSIRSLANATGMGTVRLRKALVDAGLVPETSGKPAAWELFDAATAEALVRPMLEGFGWTEVIERFNFPRDQLEVMVKAGFIIPLPTGEGTYPRFHPAEIQRFLDRLLQGAVVTTQAKPDYHDIPAACRRLVCSAREIVALILDGRLKKICRHTDREGYLAVLVNVREIRPCLVRASASGLTVEQAAERLGVTQVQMRAMIRDGVMKADLAPNPVTAKPQPYVSEAHLRDFRMEFMTCKDLADWLGLDRDMVKKHLKVADVHPIGPPDKPYGFTYRRLRIHERFVQALRSGAGSVSPISET